jgi:type II secretory pathway pseudopilin PulG
MEMVIVLGIFSIATTYALAIFTQSNTVQKRTANIQRSTSDARYVLEVMAREFRMGSVDYDYSGYTTPLTSPEDELALLDDNNSPVIFRKALSLGRQAVQVCYGSVNCVSNEWLDITPTNIKVKQLSFYISPVQDPFTWQTGTGYDSDLQPRVTIILETESNITDSERLHESHFQTTISSRKYER